MSRMKWVLVVLLLSSSSAYAAEQTGLDALLQQVQQAASTQAHLSAQRQAEFLKARNKQAAMLSRANADLKSAKARADKLRATYQANEKALAQLQQKVNSSSSEQGQLYGVVHQAARHFRDLARDSIISAQYPDRVNQLDKLADISQVPDLAQLNNFWFLLQQQLVASGQVTRFDTHVIGRNGESLAAVVTRIGSFMALSGPSALVLQPDTTQLQVLSRQPSGFSSLARDYIDSKKPVAPMLLDPSRGHLLVLAENAPTWADRIEDTGVIAYIIIAVGMIGLACAVYQFIYLMIVGGGVRRQLKDPNHPSEDNPLGRVLSCLSDDNMERDSEVLETEVSEAVLRETPKLERFQPFLRMVVAAGPLLGLLGTVTGMIRTFQVIVDVGATDPKLMAGGIGQAMTATVLGLLVAIPNLFINSLLGSRSRILIQILDEQAAGLIARRLEAREQQENRRVG